MNKLGEPIEYQLWNHHFVDYTQHVIIAEKLVRKMPNLPSLTEILKNHVRKPLHSLVQTFSIEKKNL